MEQAVLKSRQKISVIYFLPALFQAFGKMFVYFVIILHKIQPELLNSNK